MWCESFTFQPSFTVATFQRPLLSPGGRLSFKFRFNLFTIPSTCSVPLTSHNSITTTRDSESVSRWQKYQDTHILLVKI